MKRRILVIGLDGATFDIIDPLIKEGVMPNLKKLTEHGTVGSLQSTIPPISGAAWVALATGMKPEKTGIFDFRYRRDNSFKLYGVTSAAYYGRAVWDYLCQAGKRVGILNYPMLYPVYEVNGFMTAGIGASLDGEFAFPKHLKQELNKLAGGQYEITIPYYKPRYDDIDFFLKELNRVFTKKVQVAKSLLRKKRWDLFWVVFSETDWLQHRMWRYIDREHPLYKKTNNDKYAQSFKEFWYKVDESIGRLCSAVSDDTNIIILSDHGFGLNDQVFRLNAWLEKEGYLVRKKAKTARNLNNVIVEVFSILNTIAKRIKLEKIAPGLYMRWRDKAINFRESTLDQIDLKRSLAFDPGHTIPFGGIYFNNRLVDSHQLKQKLAGEIVGRLRAFGEKHGVKIEIKWLKGISNGPDLLLGVNDWRCVIVKDQFEGEFFEQRPYASRHTGSHRMNGIFIISGPDIQHAYLNKLQIFDIAPTLLYLFDQPIPINMDGQVLKKITLEKYPQQSQTKIRTREGAISSKVSLFRTEKEEESVKKWLEDLGYL